MADNCMEAMFRFPQANSDYSFQLHLQRATEMLQSFTETMVYLDWVIDVFFGVSVLPGLQISL